jgi:hypothetical protein
LVDENKKRRCAILRRRILLVDPDAGTESFRQMMDEYLGYDFELAYCSSGHYFLADLLGFSPDLLYINMKIKDVCGFQLLQDKTLSGNLAPVVVGGDSDHTYYQSELMDFNVVKIIKCPFTLQEVIEQLRLAATGLLLSPDGYFRTDLDYILLRLGFNASSGGYGDVCKGVLIKYHDMGARMTKELYPAIAKETNATISKIEKGMRDAIRQGRDAAKGDIWLSFFPALNKDENPSNEEFLCRIALALVQRSRPRPSEEYRRQIMCDRI